MSQYFEVHPTHPQARLIKRAAEILREGGVVVFPTDSAFAIGCALGNARGVDRIRRIRAFDGPHDFSLLCRDLSDLSAWAKVDNHDFRLLRAHTPGPYTFVLTATREVPRRLVHPRRKTIGIRVPDHPVPQQLLQELGEPVMSVTLVFPGEELPAADGRAIRERLEHEVDAVIDSGEAGVQETSVVDLTDAQPTILRIGLGDVSAFEL